MNESYDPQNPMNYQFLYSPMRTVGKDTTSGGYDTNFRLRFDQDSNKWFASKSKIENGETIWSDEKEKSFEEVKSFGDWRQEGNVNAGAASAPFDILARGIGFDPDKTSSERLTESFVMDSNQPIDNPIATQNTNQQMVNNEAITQASQQTGVPIAQGGVNNLSKVENDMSIEGQIDNLLEDIPDNLLDNAMNTEYQNSVITQELDNINKGNQNIDNGDSLNFNNKKGKTFKWTVPQYKAF